MFKCLECNIFPGKGGCSNNWMVQIIRLITVLETVKTWDLEYSQDNPVKLLYLGYVPDHPYLFDFDTHSLAGIICF